MRNALLSSLIGVSVLVVAGCGHSLMRGSVVMKVDAQAAHVCLGNKEVKVGDKVGLYKNECDATTDGPRGGQRKSCRKVRLGIGTVSETLNEHYSVIRVEPGVTFDEGTTVEKL